MSSEHARMIRESHDIATGTDRALPCDAPACPQCPAVLATARDRPGEVRRCACGAEYTATAPRVRQAARAVVAWRPARVRQPSPDVDRAVRQFVADALAWDRSVQAVERAARGPRSATAALLDVGELGVLGSGCRGTKGVGRASVDEREVHAADPVGLARYLALPRELRVVVDAVCSDAQGLVQIEVALGPKGQRRLLLGLEERVALRLAAPAQAAEWDRRVMRGDQEPAKTAMLAAGMAALRAAARAWWAALGDEKGTVE